MALVLVALVGVLIGYVRTEPTACDRTFLNDMTAAYLMAQTLGEPHYIPSVAPNLTYTEQFRPISIHSGILSRPLNITTHRSFYDDMLCTAYTQYVVLDPDNLYVIGTRFAADGLYITAIETLVTEQGSPHFNAAEFARWDNGEDWSEIEQDKRDIREVIQAAGDAYLDRLANISVAVPWATHCARLEGGTYTGRENGNGNTCDLGLASGIVTHDRRYVVDDINGAVAIYSEMSRFNSTDSGLTPESHLLRIEGGHIRYIHKLSLTDVNSVRVE